MRCLTIILALALAARAIAQQTRAGDLVPIEQGTADTTATQTTLRVMPVELNESTNFLRLYGVAGRPDLLVRSHGGMYAVFDQGQYVAWRGASLPVWPSGTQFFIGRPDFLSLRAPGIRMDNESTMLPAPGIRVDARRSDPQQPDARGPDTRQDTRPAPVRDARVPDTRIDGRVKPAKRLPGSDAVDPAAEAHAVPPGSRRLEPEPVNPAPSVTPNP